VEDVFKYFADCQITLLMSIEKAEIALRHDDLDLYLSIVKQIHESFFEYDGALARIQNSQ
jgi:hypothetical protein